MREYNGIDTTIYCSHPKFASEPATYKIAAEWTGGDHSELKTYGFANDACVVEVYRSAQVRAGRFRPCEGETLGELRIFRLNPIQHDYELKRVADVEERVKTAIAGTTKSKS